MQDSVGKTLQMLLKQHGRDLYSDARRVRALLNDLCSNCDSEISVLVTAIQARIPHDLVTRSTTAPLALLLPQMEQRLRSKHAIEEQAAKWAVTTWATVLDLVPVSSERSQEMYTAEISRNNPSCFLFLVDQSYSMADPFGGSEISESKAKMLADALNRVLWTLIGRCSKDEGIRRYFQVGVIGYGAAVGPALGGNLAGRDLVWIDELAKFPIRIENRLQKYRMAWEGL